MVHARRAQSAHRVSILYLVVSSLIWCVIAAIPLVILEDALFPIGHGISQGVMIAVKHLPFVGVFLAGLWSVGRIYRRSWRKLLAILLPAPAGFLFGMAMVYGFLLIKDIAFRVQSAY